MDYAAGPVLTTPSLEVLWEHYLGAAADGPLPKYVVPASSGDLAGLPPTLVITAECDPLRDDGEEYVRMLVAAGVPTTHQRFDGLIHATIGLSALIPGAADMRRAAVDFVTQTVRVGAGV